MDGNEVFLQSASLTGEWLRPSPGMQHQKWKSSMWACTHTTETLDEQKRVRRLDLTDFKVNSSLKYDLDAKKATLTEPQLKDSGV